MKLLDAYGDKCVPCCDTMRAAMKDSVFGIPGRTGVFSVGLYTGCDDFSLRPIPRPFVEGSEVGEAFESCPWCGEKIEDCFAGTKWDHPIMVRLCGPGPFPHLSGFSGVLSGDAHEGCGACKHDVNDPSLFKKAIGSNRMELCPRHCDVFEAWFKTNSREVEPYGQRVWL